MAGFSEALGGMGGMIGSAYGWYQGAGDRANNDIMEYNDLQDWEKMQSPQLRQLVAEQMGKSGFEDVKDDPVTMAAQRAALARLSNISANGGMDAMGRASLEQGRQAASGMASGANAALRSRMASRGMMGSGAELAAESGNNSAAAQRLSQSGYDAAAAAQNRNIQALNGAGGLSTQMRTQDYNKSADLARAKDAIAYHNMQNRTDANRYNALLPQQQWENDMRMRGAKSARRMGHVKYVADRDQQNTETYEGMGKGIGSTVGWGLDAYASNGASVMGGGGGGFGGGGGGFGGGGGGLSSGGGNGMGPIS